MWLFVDRMGDIRIGWVILGVLALTVGIVVLLVFVAIRASTSHGDYRVTLLRTSGENQVFRASEITFMSDAHCALITIDGRKIDVFGQFTVERVEQAEAPR
jgi:hypothetical protein